MFIDFDINNLIDKISILITIYLVLFTLIYINKELGRKKEFNIIPSDSPLSNNHK